MNLSCCCCCCVFHQRLCHLPEQCGIKIRLKLHEILAALNSRNSKYLSIPARFIQMARAKQRMFDKICESRSRYIGKCLFWVVCLVVCRESGRHCFRFLSAPLAVKQCGSSANNGSHAERGAERSPNNYSRARLLPEKMFASKVGGELDAREARFFHRRAVERKLLNLHLNI